MLDILRLRAAYEKVRDELLSERTAEGHWIGELSSSALSTAIAVSALALVRNNLPGQPSTRHSVPGTQDSVPSTPSPLWLNKITELVHLGVSWLAKQQNDDGGFGDTDLSHSNIATTYLVVAALHLAGAQEQHAELLKRADSYLAANGRLAGLRQRYGIDKTFVVPIMTNLALAGLVDWDEIDSLPFELACVPQSWYRFVGMPVVSYAIPALVAIGQARFFHAPPANPLMRLMRRMAIGRSLSVLRRMQPESGGYLEATPLTSFVVMSLASIRLARPPTAGSPADQVIRAGVKFLLDSVRPDGSWPIDTNLATWNTTLSVNALAGAGENVTTLLGDDCLNWLLSCQHNKRHAFTGANPGGFGWSDLSGAVPDADDTPGAMLALGTWRGLSQSADAKVATAIGQAHAWLARLRNRDGGWPTFCRGWGKLPFDRSGADLTAHVLRAKEDRFPDPFGDREGLQYLAQRQNSDGSWIPLWFGNQDRPNDENPVYGTAKVLMAYHDLGLMNEPEAQRGINWLLVNQNSDGGWGSGAWANVRSAEAKRTTQRADKSLGEPVLSTQYSVLSTSEGPDAPNPKSKVQNLKSPVAPLQSSIEETSLALEALLAALPTSDPRPPTSPLNPEPRTLTPPAAAVTRGLAWLINRVEQNQHRQPAPIGFYFAKLWYYEKLYPLIFATAALGRACRQFAPRPDELSQPETATRRSS